MDNTINEQIKELRQILGYLYSIGIGWREDLIAAHEKNSILERENEHLKKLFASLGDKLKDLESKIEEYNNLEKQIKDNIISNLTKTGNLVDSYNKSNDIFIRLQEQLKEGLTKLTTEVNTIRNEAAYVKAIEEMGEITALKKKHTDDVRLAEDRLSELARKAKEFEKKEAGLERNKQEFESLVEEFGPVLKILQERRQSEQTRPVPDAPNTGASLAGQASPRDSNPEVGIPASEKSAVQSSASQNQGFASPGRSPITKGAETPAGSPPPGNEGRKSSGL